MKAKLIKEYEDYYLISDKEIESGDEYVKLDNRPRTLLLGTTISHVTKVSKLSKQNCDEIFAVVDVEKLARERLNATGWDADLPFIAGFKDGFNKAMELNKDKVFTEEDMKKAINLAYVIGKSDDTYQECEKFVCEQLQSIKQPTEIEVEVCCLVDGYDGSEDSFNSRMLANTGVPKLDSQGCLILKKI
jgi:hypothetical protein